MHQTALSLFPPLRVAILGSGSQGNAVVIESGKHRILIDAGFSAREMARRMEPLEVDPDSFEALLLTHEHGDHTRGARVFSHRHGVPVYATEGTLAETELAEPGRRLRSGEICQVSDGFEVEPFGIPHDAREPIGMVVRDGYGRRVGLVADLGARSRLAWGKLRDLDVLILETNHDLELLRRGPYPWYLKQRVAGRHGHLSNREAAEGIPELVNDRLQWVALYHLSQTNNLPALAAVAVDEALDTCGCHANTVMTYQDRPTPWLEVSG